MALTRANAENVLVKRARGKMEVVSMAVTVVGTNADLDDPLTSAFRAMGYTPASPITITDADLVSLPDADVPEFLDRATLALLKNIHTNIDLVDIKSGPQDEKLSQLSTQVEKAIDVLKADIEANYSSANPNVPVVGIIRTVHRDGYRVTEEEA